MLYASNLRHIFWAEAAITAIYLLNRSPTSALDNKLTPYEAWTGTKPELNHQSICSSKYTEVVEFGPCPYRDVFFFFSATGYCAQFYTSLSFMTPAYIIPLHHPFYIIPFTSSLLHHPFYIIPFTSSLLHHPFYIIPFTSSFRSSHQVIYLATDDDFVLLGNSYASVYSEMP